MTLEPGVRDIHGVSALDCSGPCGRMVTLKGGQPSLHHSAVRQQLERILAHGLFARSERIGRFLRFVVERTLEGRAAELKEYVIGVEAFDRKQSFDPRVDPIVRVEARRLRSKLKAYYEGDGRENPIVIELVSGGYAPRIRPGCPSAATAGNLPAQANGIATTTVLPFINLGPDPECQYFSDGLTEELIHALTKVPGMRLVAWNSSAWIHNGRHDITAIGRQLQVATVLTGSVRISGASLRVCSHLINAANGVYLRSETFDRKMRAMFTIQQEIAWAIAGTLGVPLAAGRGSSIIGQSPASMIAG